MGIPRLTQDLRPYLESAQFSQRKDVPQAIHLVALVIDGPSMVYHVYNKLASYDATISTTPGISALPSYRELNLGITQFLTDLQSCGAKIEHIFFDGALPLSKRIVRIERLERSRNELQVLRLASPYLSLSPTRDPATLALQLSVALWQLNKSGTIVPAPPFIVPAALEHLKKSRWTEIVKVVPGEADGFCASAAGRVDAAVLTNDSDLILFAAMQDQGSVVLLHSLRKDAGSGTVETATIEAQCWRQSHITHQLGISDLLIFGYERSKDPSASFLAIKQRAKLISPTCDTGFGSFARQYDQVDHTVTAGLQHKTSFDHLDPRFSEFVCQVLCLPSIAPTSDSSGFHVSFPILHEDPTRDSSWKYGRHYRQMAYSLISSYHSRHRIFQKEDRENETHSFTGNLVLEFTRKGQRIAEERLAKLTDTNLQCLFESHSSVFERYLRRPGNSICVDFVFCALRHVCEQRRIDKAPFSTHLIKQYLGLAPLLNETKSFGVPMDRSRAAMEKETDLDANGWSLLHLNANVQAVLYSFRMLKQAINFVRSHKFARDHDGAQQTSQSSQLNIALDEAMRNLGDLLHLMPPIEDSHLSPSDLRQQLRQLPVEELQDRIDALTADVEIPRYQLLNQHVKVDVPQKSSGTLATNTTQTTEASWEVQAKKRKRDKHSQTNHKGASTQPVTSGTNPFDLLRKAPR